MASHNDDAWNAGYNAGYQEALKDSEALRAVAAVVVRNWTDNGPMSEALDDLTYYMNTGDLWPK